MQGVPLRGQENHLQPVVGAGPGFAQVLGGRSAQLLCHVPPAPFLPLIPRAIATGDPLAHATAGAGGDDSVNAK
jgi:hypothetical protein